MAQPARLTSGLLARKGQALPTGGFAHAKLDLVPLQPSVAKAEQHRCGTSVPREALLPELRRPAPEPSRRPAPAQDDRVALTLRLDRARYTRLKKFSRRGAPAPARSCCSERSTPTLTRAPWTAPACAAPAGVAKTEPATTRNAAAKGTRIWPARRPDRSRLRDWYMARAVEFSAPPCSPRARGTVAALIAPGRVHEQAQPASRPPFGMPLGLMRPRVRLSIAN